MGFNFLSTDREQTFLVPPSIADWLPEDHLAWFIIDAVEQIDLTPFLSSYRRDGRGGAAYHPAMMLALLVYSYACGELSSRKIEQACHTDVAFRVITGNQFPDHTAIARFRQKHADRFAHLFTEVLALCAQAGLASVGIVAIDGTKLGSPAALSANKTSEQIDKAVQQIIADAEAVDKTEDAEHGEGVRGDEPPTHLRGRKERRERFEEAKRILDEKAAAQDAAHEQVVAERERVATETGEKARGRKPVHPREKKGVKPAKVNTTDPESKIMPVRKGGFVQGWNGQAAANEHQVILAAEIVTDTNDTQLLRPMIDAITHELTQAGITDPVEVLLADAGYATESALATLTENDPDCFIATRNTYKNPEPRLGRRGPIPKDATLVQRMDRKVSTKHGKAVYRDRQWIIEPVFGHIKHNRGITTLARRGKQAAQAEWKLVTATHNLLKLFRHAHRPQTDGAFNAQTA